MSEKPTFGKLDFQLGVGPAEAAHVEAETPLRILVLGDFSGRVNRGEIDPKFAGRAQRLVDRDNVEAVMRQMGAKLTLTAGNGARCRVELAFSEMDDFHPDRIYERLELFQTLRRLRNRLADPATFAEAAQELAVPAPAESPADVEQAADAPTTAPAVPETEGVLESILEGMGDVASGSEEVDWQVLVRDIVKPYVLPRRDPRQAELVANVDEAIGKQMVALLHHPGFQEMEAAWRGLHMLTRRLETDANLKLSVVDLAQAELEADLGDLEDLTTSQTYKLLVEQSVGTPGAHRWSLLLCNYSFGATEREIALLGRLARIAAAAGAPVIAAASPALVGCTSLAATPDPDDWKSSLEPPVQEAWRALQQMPEAAYLGLILARFLARLPYGKKTDPVERFAFEEMPAEAPGHESYLWANPVWVAAALIGQAFSERGWQFKPGMVRQFDRLPVHFYQQDGQTETKPCAEAWLSDRAADVVAGKGLILLRSIKGQDAVRIDQFISAAGPGHLLRGRWS